MMSLTQRFLLLCVLVIIGLSSDRLLGDDNIIEELAELAIDLFVGVNIDISPASPENPEQDLNKMFFKKTNHE